MVSEAFSYQYQPGANNDTDNNVILTMRTGNYATSFTISGNVGASGDVIIITEIYCQIVLRGNNTDSLNTFTGWELLIKEKGMMTVTSRHVAIDGSNQFVAYYIITKNGYLNPYNSSSGLDVSVTDLIFESNDSPEIVWFSSTGHDFGGSSFFLYLNIIVIGA